jgi:DNA-directed RNA polymerase specialized sigma24 family protein
MANRPPSQPPGDEFNHRRDVDDGDLIPDEAVTQTDVDLSADMGQFDDQRASRLEADRRLVEMMAEEGFEGEKFDQMFAKLARKLYGYAWPILLRWTANGQIFRECDKYRRPVARPAVAHNWTLEDRRQIVTDTCLAAVDFFRDYALRRSHWDWRRRACLATYFVGACVCCFAKVFERWWKERLVAESVRLAAQDRDDTGDDPLDRLIPPEPDPALVAITRDEAGRAMRQVRDPQLREVLWLRAIGFTQADAAKQVGITEKAVEGRLDRHRKKLRGESPANTADPGEGGSL